MRRSSASICSSVTPACDGSLWPSSATDCWPSQLSRDAARLGNRAESSGSAIYITLAVTAEDTGLTILVVGDGYREVTFFAQIKLVVWFDVSHLERSTSDSGRPSQSAAEFVRVRGPETGHAGTTESTGHAWRTPTARPTRATRPTHLCRLTANLLPVLLNVLGDALLERLDNLHVRLAVRSTHGLSE